MRDDGGVRVVNRGFSVKDQRWKEAEGKAYFVRSPEEGYLKVSFFGPFYGSYVVFELDRNNYEYAFVAGPSRSYLWLLARTPTVSDELVEKFVQRSRELGFDTDGLIFVDHNQPDEIPHENLAGRGARPEVSLIVGGMAVRMRSVNVASA
jgi:apolipoprotein D and lipocalin family protein